MNLLLVVGFASPRRDDVEGDLELFTLRPKADSQFSLRAKLPLFTPPRENESFETEVLRQVKNMTSDYVRHPPIHPRSSFPLTLLLPHPSLLTTLTHPHI
jgi:hypothetical protein